MRSDRRARLERGGLEKENARATIAPDTAFDDDIHVLALLASVSPPAAPDGRLSADPRSCVGAR